MIDHFSKDEFEKALPVAGGLPLWRPLGLRAGEHCYGVPVKPGVLIHIRSSVGPDGHAADTAKDSIRCWLSADEGGKPLGSKDSRWIARTNGWQRRLTETLRTLWRMGRQLDACPECGRTMLALKVKRDGPNVGRWFAKCMDCNRDGGWLKTAQ